MRCNHRPEATPWWLSTTAQRRRPRVWPLTAAAACGRTLPLACEPPPAPVRDAGLGTPRPSGRGPPPRCICQGLVCLRSAAGPPPAPACRWRVRGTRSSTSCPCSAPYAQPSLLKRVARASCGGSSWPSFACALLWRKASISPQPTPHHASARVGEARFDRNGVPRALPPSSDSYGSDAMMVPAPARTRHCAVGFDRLARRARVRLKQLRALSRARFAARAHGGGSSYSCAAPFACYGPSRSDDLEVANASEIWWKLYKSQ